MALTSSELNKLIKTNVPSNLASTLEETCPEFYPNIFYLLSVLAVLPITTCDLFHLYVSLNVKVHYNYYSYHLRTSSNHFPLIRYKRRCPGHKMAA